MLPKGIVTGHSLAARGRLGLGLEFAGNERACFDEIVDVV